MKTVKSAYSEKQLWKLKIRAFIFVSELLSVFDGLPMYFNKELRLESLAARSPGGGVYPTETWNTSNQLHGAGVFPPITSQHCKHKENMFSETLEEPSPFRC